MTGEVLGDVHMGFDEAADDDSRRQHGCMLSGESNGHLWLGPETDDLAGPNRDCPPRR